MWTINCINKIKIKSFFSELAVYDNYKSKKYVSAKWLGMANEHISIVHQVYKYDVNYHSTVDLIKELRHY